MLLCPHNTSHVAVHCMAPTTTNPTSHAGQGMWRRLSRTGWRQHNSQQGHRDCSARSQTRGHAAAAPPSAARSSASQALASTWRPRRRLQDTARSRSRAMRTGRASSAASSGAAAPRSARHVARACSSSSLSAASHRPLQGPVTAGNPGACPCQAFGSRTCTTRMLPVPHTSQPCVAWTCPTSVTQTFGCSFQSSAQLAQAAAGATIAIDCSWLCQ